MQKARVSVTLKTGVLDPQGEAIKKALENLGFSNVASVRQGKLFDIELKTLDSKEEINKMSEKLLINGLIENYTVEFL